jgi:hypothetical protein
VDVFQHHRGLRHPERRSRLIENEDLGAEVDRTRNRNALAFAPRQSAHCLIGIADIDADLTHLFPRYIVAMRKVEVTEREEALARLPPHEEITGDRHQRDHGKVLIHGRNPCIERIARTAEIDRLAFDQEGTATWADDTGQRLDQGGLASAIVSEQTKHLSGRHLH